MTVDPNEEEPPPPIVVHDLDQARAALAAAAALGRPVILRSAPDAAAYLGAGAFRAIVAAAQAAVPQAAVTAVLDCGDAPGLALGALRIGIPAVRLRAAPGVLARVADIAAQYGARLDSDDRPALDLKDAADPEAACRRWLGGV
jgi:hypothetical protein